jgi:hypothetical protein
VRRGPLLEFLPFCLGKLTRLPHATE